MVRGDVAAVQQQNRSKIPLVAAAIAGLLLIIGVRTLTSGGDDSAKRDDSTPVTDDRTGCTEFTFIASSEKAALLQAVANDYIEADRDVGGRCVSPKVFTKSSGGATEALARGWDDARDGPRPDVWSPAASSWAVLLTQRLAARDQPDLVPGDNASDLPSVARTPLVFAMPKPMAEALGWPDKAIGFSDILGLARDPSGWGKFKHPEWGKFRLGKTNPNFSTSGLHATVGSYFAATGVSSDLTVRNVEDPKTIAYVKEVEQTVVHYGDTTLTFLENLQRADDAGRGLTYISAATIEEKSVWDYNQGNPTGDPKTLGKHKPPRVPLVAIYPKEGTLYSDNPYVILDAPWVDAEKKSAAEDFLEFLQEDDQQRRFQDAAFRNFEGKAGKLITEAEGMLPDEPKVTLSPPSPAVLDLVQRSWSKLRKPAQVLLVIDVSGSMGEPVPSAGTTKLELAKAAAAKALDQFAPEDEVGLWIFSTGLDGDKPYLPLVPIAPMKTNLAPLRSKIGSLVADGGTGLYATARASTAFMRTRLDEDRINAVVLLTDGKNEFPADTDVEGLIRSLGSESEDASVRLFTVAYGEDADLATLKRIAEASRAAAYDASDASSIDRVFTAVISNF
jgi:Ca-activated chloride channel family protein